MSPLITRWFSNQNNSSLTYTIFFVSLQSEQQLDKMLKDIEIVQMNTRMSPAWTRLNCSEKHVQSGGNEQYIDFLTLYFTFLPQLCNVK